MCCFAPFVLRYFMHIHIHMGKIFVTPLILHPCPTSFFFWVVQFEMKPNIVCMFLYYTIFTNSEINLKFIVCIQNVELIYTLIFFFLIPREPALLVNSKEVYIDLKYSHEFNCQFEILFLKILGLSSCTSF